MADNKKKYKVVCQVNLDTNPDNYKTIEVDASGKNAAQRMAVGTLLNSGYFHACPVSCEEVT